MVKKKNLHFVEFTQTEAASEILKSFSRLANYKANNRYSQGRPRDLWFTSEGQEAVKVKYTQTLLFDSPAFLLLQVTSQATVKHLKEWWTPPTPHSGALPL